jgi:hypothetical protein
MPRARLTEAYYLRLKTAIASQAARMFPYRYLQETRTIGERGFLERYRFEKIKAAWRYRLFLLKRLLGLTKGSALEKQVAKANLQAKYLSFKKDKLEALVIYRRLVYMLYKIRV